MNQKNKKNSSLQKAQNQNNQNILKQHQVVSLQQAMYQGPIPCASELERYESAVKGSAERIFVMAERQAEHRQCLEKIVISSENKRATFGVICALTISLGSFVVAGILASNGNAVSGTILSGTTIASLVGTFIYGTRTRNAERLAKAEMLKPQASPKESEE